MIVQYGSPTPDQIREGAAKHRDAYVIKLLMRLNRATHWTTQPPGDYPRGAWLRGVQVLSRRFNISMIDMSRLLGVADHEQDSDSEYT